MKRLQPFLSWLDFGLGNALLQGLGNLRDFTIWIWQIAVADIVCRHILPGAFRQSPQTSAYGPISKFPRLLKTVVIRCPLRLKYVLVRVWTNPRILHDDVQILAHRQLPRGLDRRQDNSLLMIGFLLFNY